MLIHKLCLYLHDPPQHVFSHRCCMCRQMLTLNEDMVITEPIQEPFPIYRVADRFLLYDANGPCHLAAPIISPFLCPVLAHFVHT